MIEFEKIDPFRHTANAVSRLWKEYLEHKKLIIAVDYDDTLFDFHKKGYTYDKVINLVKECQALDFHIVIFTGSPKDRYDSIREYCKTIGITVDKINENPFPLPFGNDGKIYFNILLDDRAGLGQAYDILSTILLRIKMLKDDPNVRFQ